MAGSLAIASNIDIGPANPIPPSTPSFQSIRMAQAELRGLIGRWTLRWEGARDTYTGTLTVTRRADTNLYVGNIVLQPSKGGTVVQSVRISSSGNELRIECAEPRVNGRPSKTYNPDRFFVVKDDDRMEGYSLDTAGNRGPKIVFDKVR